MAWYQRIYYKYFKSGIVSRYIWSFCFTLLFLLPVFLFENVTIHCVPFRGVGEYLKEIPHNGKILMSTKDLTDYKVKLNYDNSYEYFLRLLFNNNNNLNYDITKYSVLVDGKINNFYRTDPRSHFHWNFRYFDNIYSNFLFTHNIPYNDFTLIKGSDLFGLDNKRQYISNRIYFYSNTHIPKYYNNIYNIASLNNKKPIEFEKIEEFLLFNDNALKEHLMRAFNFKK